MSQVNLLPPELRARQKTKQLTTLLVGAGVALIVLLMGFWFLQGQKLAGVDDDVAAQNLTNSGLQTQIDQLQEFQQLQEQAAVQLALLTKAYAGEVSFSQMLMDLSRTIPSDAYLDSFNAALAAPATAGSVPTTTTSFVGSFTASGASDGLESLASWLTRLESVKGWVNPWFSSATETAANSGLYTFSGGGDLSQDTLTARGREGGPGGG
ncbi:MAG: PilN domain-containing protein [Actinomycetota bacterium]